MILIGENIHVISKSVQNALQQRDEEFIRNLVKLQNYMDYIDLNVGPAKGNLEGILPWLSRIVEQETNLGISFDTTNSDEMERGLNAFNKNVFINSTSKDEPRLSNLTDLALKFDANLIALTLSKETGIPKTADGRVEIAFEICEKCLEKGLNNEKLFFDPLILPVCVDQSQALEALSTIKMIKESFDPPVKTVVGLSNVSNGCPKELRPLINRVFGCLAFGAGLDSAIIDARDLELVTMFRMLENQNPKSDIDELYINLAEMVRNFADLNDVKYDEHSKEHTQIIKTAGVLLNREIYSHSFTQI